MKPRVKIIIVLLCAVLIAVLLRAFVVGSYSVPFEGMEPSLHKGERILVNKWNYKRVKRGDIIVFDDPSTTKGDKTLVGRVMALPGDVIYMDHAFNFSKAVNLQDTLPAQPIMIPLKGVETPIRPWNATLMRNTLTLHEGLQAEVKDGVLYIDGKATNAYNSKQSYYWVMMDTESTLSDSRLFGFVPEDHLIGKATRIWFSNQLSRLWKKVE